MIKDLVILLLFILLYYHIGKNYWYWFKYETRGGAGKERQMVGSYDVSEFFWYLVLLWPVFAMRRQLAWAYQRYVRTH